MTFTPPTVALIAALVGATGFAIGRATVSPVVVRAEVPSAPAADPPQAMGTLPAGHPAITGSGDFAPPAAQESTLAWKAPSSWQKVPSTSSMRLATYRVPHVPGEAEDPELSITQAGGSLDQNIDRWVGQFGEEGKKTVKRTKKTVGGLPVTVVEMQGTYAGGMNGSADPEANWALLAAIVETPGMPHFFKMTGPMKSVAAARADFDAFIASLTTK